VDIIIAEKAKVFVSAVGVAPKHIIERLHKHGILYMNMIGHPKHAHKACQAGADLICAQGGEAGGHTGDTATTYVVPRIYLFIRSSSIPKIQWANIDYSGTKTSVLIPAVADICKKYTSPLTGKPVQVVAAGGIYDGRGIAAALMLGAGAIWVGTRFVTAKESGAPEVAKKA